MGKKIKVPELLKSEINLTFICKNCQEENLKVLNELWFTSNSSDCEMCGSYGSSEVDITCHKCNHVHRVILNEW